MIEGTDLFIGLSGPGIISAKDLERMNPDPFVFAMANPNPEVRPEEAAPYVRVMATGRSDYPNQINNVLAFPGVFRGALDVRATAITEEMKLAAARGIASVVEDDELDEDYIIPSVFNRDVGRAVARAVAEVAERSSEAERGRAADGGARRDRLSPKRRLGRARGYVFDGGHDAGRGDWSHRDDRPRAGARAARARRRGHGAVARRRAGLRRAGRARARLGRRRRRSRRPPRRCAAATRWSTCWASRSPSAGPTTPSARSATRACSARATWSRRWRELPEDERPRVLVSQSAAGYYGARGDERLDETAPPATTSSPSSCVDWEAEARAAEELGVRVVMTRTGVVLSESGGALEKMLPPFKLGVGGPVAGGRQYVPWVHLDDVVGALLFALDTRGRDRARERDRARAGDQQRALAGARQGAAPSRRSRPSRRWR